MSLFPELEIERAGVPKFDNTAPLAVRVRPQSINEFLGQTNILTVGSPIERFLNASTKETSLTPPSLILWGPPGTGKTTLAYLIAKESNKRFVELSAVSDGVNDVRFIVLDAKERHFRGQETILFIDEIHRFSKNQQDSLLPAVENRWVTLIAATTENPNFSIIAPLISRSITATLKNLDEEHLKEIVDNALISERGLKNKYSISDEAKEILSRISGGDARKALTILETAAGVCDSMGETEITKDFLEKAAHQAFVRWDNDQHYDMISAFIKSMRGSDPDATLHYLARMIESGEDPRFIARRIMIAASEDVGLADSSVLQTTVAAAQAVALIGFPEARIILSQAALAVALAPKSNSAYVGIDNALKDIRSGFIGTIPSHLRDAHYYGAKALGNGVKYDYPHNHSEGVSSQKYLPQELEGKEYYSPTNIGEEKVISERLLETKKILNKEKTKVVKKTEPVVLDDFIIDESISTNSETINSF